MESDFYQTLYNDARFCEALGKVILATSKLESLLREYLEIQGISIPHKKATLGNLIREIDREKLLSKGMIEFLSTLKEQRNYLSHNIYYLLIGEIEETLLAKGDSLSWDEIYYAQHAEQTAENCNDVAHILQKNIEEQKKR